MSNTTQITRQLTEWLRRAIRPAAVLTVMTLGMGAGPGVAVAHGHSRHTPMASNLGPTSRPPTADAAASPSTSAADQPAGAVAAASVFATRPIAGATAGASGALALAKAAANTYVHYYLWWSIQHWHDKLGPRYPYTANPLPLPGSTDSTGCNPRPRYAGATIVDIPSEGLYDQDLASTYDRHIATAAAAGIRGFVVSWQGDGTPSQTAASTNYSTRLALLASRVHVYNAAHASPFTLALGMSAYGNYSRPAGEIINDLNYFSRSYASDSAFANRFSTRPLVMILASRKLSPGTLGAVSRATRAKLFLLGDETASTWSTDGPLLDGTSYYWSSEDPSQYTRDSLISLGNQVHAAGKPWFSPFTPGFGNQLQGGTCVPRNRGATLAAAWSGNSASHPDGWMGISWNEFVENTYLEPSLAYGTTYLDQLRRLIAAG